MGSDYKAQGPLPSVSLLPLSLYILKVLQPSQTMKPAVNKNLNMRTYRGISYLNQNIMLAFSD